MVSVFSAILKVFGGHSSVGTIGGIVTGKAASLGVSALIVTMTASAAVASLTGAVFTDSESAGGNVFSTGSVDVGTSASSAVISLTGMAPGDSVVSSLTVSNNGSLAMRYAVTSVTSENTLAAQLKYTIKAGVSTCDANGFGVDGSTLYGPAALGSTSGIKVVGDATQGADSGDRELNGAASEVLCMEVELPLETDNSLKNSSTTATLSFASEQLANNG